MSQRTQGVLHVGRPGEALGAGATDDVPAVVLGAGCWLILAAGLRTRTAPMGQDEAPFCVDRCARRGGSQVPCGFG